MERDSKKDLLMNIYLVGVFTLTCILDTWTFGLLTVLIGIFLPGIVCGIIRGLVQKNGNKFIGEYPLLWICQLVYLTLLFIYL